jgi:hypothetical protein
MMRLYRCTRCYILLCIPAAVLPQNALPRLCPFCGPRIELEPVEITAAAHSYDYSEAGGEVTGIQTDITINIS